MLQHDQLMIQPNLVWKPSQKLSRETLVAGNEIAKNLSLKN